jgi:hypothetical protein
VKRSRLWTEEELVLLLWCLPIVTAIASTTHRDFSAIAMKLANLLAAETEGKQGLANYSALDKATVAKYRHDRRGLESKVVRILQSGRPQSERSAEIRESAIDVVRRHGAPMHLDLIAAILAARDITLIAATSTIEKSLSGHPMIKKLDNNVYTWRSDKST